MIHFLIAILFSFNTYAGIQLPPKTEVEIKRNSCKEFTLNEPAVKKIFSTYKLINAKEMHDNYHWSSCFVFGTVKTHGRVFKWKISQGNVLETEFPDNMMRTYGGEPTDHPSGN